LETIVARCFSFVGVDLPLKAHFAIGNFIHDALYNDEITINGDGTAVRSYLDQRDLADWLMQLLFRGKSGETYNVGSDKQLTILETAELVRNVIAPQKEIILKNMSINSGIRGFYVPDINKITKDLGLNAPRPLKSSIRDIVDALSYFL
jgi:UDP-glucuronate decarboxylase